MNPEIVVCTYSVKAGQMDAFRDLLKTHYPRLAALGLVEPEPRLMLESLDENRFVEVFAWKSAEAVETAHHHPAVMQIWEPMGALCENMDFPHYKNVA